MSLQETFVQEKASQVQDRIEAFDHCHIRLLNKDAIEEIVLQYECTHSTELVYNMCKCDCFQIIIVPTHTRHRMDLITRFNRDRNLDFVFGKNKRDAQSDHITSKRLRTCQNETL